MNSCIQISLFLVCCVLQGKIVLPACSGSGFPVEWTNATDDTYWFFSLAFKRQFTAGYIMTDYYTNGSSVTCTCASPTCQDDFYNPTTGYHYYRMSHNEGNIYIPYLAFDACHGFKQYDNVIREFVDIISPEATAMDCEEELLLPESLALLKYNSQYTDCPFEFTTYTFTFSDGGNPDYCAGTTSEAIIANETITLKSCYDPSNVTSATPYNGNFSCRGSWQAEENDDITKGDFIVIEMYDDEQWPYCGRYKVDANGVIILSISLSISKETNVPVLCDSLHDNEYMSDDGNNFKAVRMVFTPNHSNTIPQKSSEFPYWWIIVGVSIPLIVLLTCCIIYAAKKGKAKVDNHKQDE
ncbi:uncharacterized protein LOC134683929 [Mytilus trossulus]|uniref:uncharacterized protein LOC134683929 n=1 Tax=Mytilus trossulus TaxID=6551 RepID=UPI0030044AE0